MVHCAKAFKSCPVSPSCLSTNSFNKATAEGTLVSEPYELQTDWETANYDVRHANRAADGSSW